MPRGAHRRSRVFRWLHGERGSPGLGISPSEYDPDHVARIVDGMGWLFGPGRYFPVEAEGWENLPDSPVILVSNHSGGSSIPDCWGWAYAWYHHFGPSRPLHLLAHEVILSTRVTGSFFGRAGILRASRHRAEEVLLQWGRDLMVMPGGDRDVWRAWKDRHRVRFAGHVGYARLALRTGVPIVPLAHSGPHDTLMVLTDGAAIARRLRLHDLLRIDVFPIHLSLPWGLGFGPLPTLPLPARLRYRLGPPILPPPDAVPGRDPDEAMVHAHDRKVRAAVQDLLDGLADEVTR